MSIPWSPAQQKKVSQVLATHPAESNRCDEAAKEILPTARELDAEARARKLLPREGRYVVTRRPLARRWFFHVAVHVQEHVVDALTGADGTPTDAYLQMHWMHADCLAWEDEAPTVRH